MINIFKNKYYRAVVLYKMAIFIGFFIIFVSMTTVIAINRVQLARCHVGLKQALSILSQALVFANFDSNNEKRPDIYYYYLVDAFNTHFESTNCAHSKELACHIGEYYTMNNKAKMSSLIFRKGAKISINNILFMINQPRFPEDALLVIIDSNGGNMKPNRLGHDVFVFQIINNRVKAMGNKGTLYPLNKYKFYCNNKSTSHDELLGVNCTYNAFFDDKYFSRLW